VRAPIRRLGKRGTATVISTIMLSAVVIAVGGAVWFYCQSASVLVAKDYVEGVTSLMYEATERFAVEHVGYDSQSQTLRVWLYNYGSTDVVVDVYASVEGSPFVSSLENPVGAKELVDVGISLNASSGNEIVVKVVSRRGNNAYYTYVVP